jgi:hypothetical protein
MPKPTFLRTVVSSQQGLRMIPFGVVGTTGVAEVSTVTCGADTAGSLNNKYFTFNTPAAAYYCWLNVNSAGVDPAVANKTGVEVAIATGATASDVATAVAAAIDALALIAATASVADVTITNAADGANTDVGAGNSGFSVAVATAGVTSLVALGEGKYDGTIAEGSGAGDYTITFREKFARAPQAIVQVKTDDRVAKIVSISTSSINVKTENLSGNAADSDFDLLVIGSDQADAI